MTVRISGVYLWYTADGCEELILGNMHYIYSVIWFLWAWEKAVINYRNLMERGTVKLYKFPTGRRDKETAEEAALWKADLYATSVGDSILDTWHELRDIASNVAGLSFMAAHSALC